MAKGITMHRYSLVLLHSASLVLLFLGWTQDMLHISVSANFIVNIPLFSEQRSIMGTLQSLWESGNIFPFSLILFFGILIPLVKSAAIFVLLLRSDSSQRWYGFVAAISKWAMADVFAVSIFVAFIGAKSMQSTTAILEPGFYYFAAYVLLSIVVAMLVGKWLAKMERLPAGD